jgi:hypothetical protein
MHEAGTGDGRRFLSYPAMSWAEVSGEGVTEKGKEDAYLFSWRCINVHGGVAAS